MFSKHLFAPSCMVSNKTFPLAVTMVSTKLQPIRIIRKMDGTRGTRVNWNLAQYSTTIFTVFTLCEICPLKIAITSEPSTNGQLWSHRCFYRQKPHWIKKEWQKKVTIKLDLYRFYRFISKHFGNVENTYQLKVGNLKIIIGKHFVYTV